jgi:hypothetical protein
MTSPVTASLNGIGTLAAGTGPYPIHGEFPLWEHFLSDLLTPIAHTTNTLPATADAVAAALPMYWARRVGGGVDKDGITDTAHVQVVAFASIRDQAQMLAMQARDALLCAPGQSVNGVVIDWAEEIPAIGIKTWPVTVHRTDGFTEFPDLDPLNEMFEVAFSLDARRQQ